MKFTFPENKTLLWLLVFLIMLGIGTFVYNQYLISDLLQKERNRIELWAKAIEFYGSPQHVGIRRELNDVIEQIQGMERLNEKNKRDWTVVLERAQSELANSSLGFVANELVIKKRFQIPSVVIDADNNILHVSNLDREDVTPELLEQFESDNKPIVIEIGEGDFTEKQYVYYGESHAVKMLRLFPYIQIGLLALLIGVGLVSYNSVRKTEQSNLWVGMAKEAAHQLGTPLSGLYGWIAVLRDLHKDEQTQNMLDELESDTGRLQSIADRFNKIGSLPELEECEITPILHEVIKYMKRRLPNLAKQVKLELDIKVNAKIPVNPELFRWAIENLVKNAMDAINKTHNKSFVAITARRVENELIIDVSDSGIGISKKDHEKIFKPGFSTKKRGWGLGLSLTRRIIEEYHNGEICVLESEPGKGTTIRIMLPVVV